MESLRRVYTTFNDLIKHPEVIRYVKPAPNLYTATFHHLDTMERLTLLEFWSQHHEASGKKFSMLFQNKFAIMVTMLTQLTQASISRNSSRTGALFRISLTQANMPFPKGKQRAVK